MGGLYQLNTAFKSWANNYFGDYLACLLETGDLPTIGGTPGDSGICDEMFKPFSLAEGRPLKSSAGGGEGGEGGKNGQREARRAGGGGGGGGGGGYGGGGGRFTGGRGGTPGMTNKPRRRASSDSSNTGNTTASDYGSGANYTQRAQRFKSREKLDNKFAFENEREAKQRRRVASTTKKSDAGEGSKPAIKLKKSQLKAKASTAGDTDFSIGNFIKYVVIACIILALIFFLGGQALSISKSMD